MRKTFILTACTLLVSLFTTAQSLLGSWETQVELDDNGTPVFITLTPFFGNDSSMALYCEMNMTIDALGQGTPEGDLEIGFATDVEGTWEKNGDQLTMMLNCDNLEVYGTNLMMPNLDVERANSIVAQLQPLFNAMQSSLAEQFASMVGAFNGTFTIVNLTDEELSIDDGSNEPVIFQKADEGNYDPE